MKKIFLFLLLTTAFAACIHSDKKNDQKKETAGTMPLGLISQPATIKVPYDSAYKDVCDTTHTLIPYDSVYTYFKDTTYQLKRKNGRVYKTITQSIPVTGHKTSFWDSLDVKCWIDTLKGYRDSIPPAYIVTEFGAKLQGDVDSQLNALYAMSATWVRTGLVLGSYTGGRDKAVDKYFAAGLHVALNLTWDAVKPSPFCTDTTLYASKLRMFFKTYAADFIKFGGFVMPENEPMNLGYYGSSPIENYITLCRIFVRIAGEYGVQTADGSLFVEYLNVAESGNIPSRITDKIATQRKLLDAFKTIPFTYLNVHLAIHDDSIEEGMIKRALDYLRAQTGKQIIVSNEYHYETCTAKSGITRKVNKEWKIAGVSVCIVWSGDQQEGAPVTSGNSPAMALSLGSKLTALGDSLAVATKY